MHRTLLALPLNLLTLLFALPAFAGDWGERWGSMVWGSVAAVPSLGQVGLWLLMTSLLGAAIWKLPRSRVHAGLVLVLLPLLPLLMAPHYTTWNAFMNGQVADATQVNENFVLAAAALDDFEVRVASLEADTQIQELTDEAGALVSLSQGITLITRSTCGEKTFVMPADGAFAGQVKHIFYDNTACPASQRPQAVARLEFQDLRVGEGLASGFFFNHSNQSVMLIYVGNAWRIANAGAIVLP